MKEQFESSGGQLKGALAGLLLSFLGIVAVVVIFKDPLGWFSGSPDVREAKKWIALSICGIFVPVFAGVWFMVIRPIQTGMVPGGGRYQAAYLVLRSEEPARFRSHVRWHCFVLAISFAIFIYVFLGLLDDLKKARQSLPEAGSAERI